MKAALSKENWNSFVAAQPAASFLQSWEWGEMQKLLQVPFRRITLPEGNTPQGVSLVVQRSLPFGRTWLYAPRGPVITPAAPLQDIWRSLQSVWEELAHEQHAIFFRCDPAWPALQGSFLRSHGWRPADRQVQPPETLVMNLTRSPEELLAAMHHKTRYNIRVAEKHGVAVRFASDTAALETFLQLCHDVEARSAFRYHPLVYYHAMQQALSPAGMFTVAIAERADKVLAAHLLISFAGMVTYAHGASSSQQREAMAPHLLQWESIKWAKASGATRYDFFGVAPEQASSDHPWAGITRFKLGFGGMREVYAGAHDWVSDSAGYALFTIARRLRRVVL